MPLHTLALQTLTLQTLPLHTLPLHTQPLHTLPLHTLPLQNLPLCGAARNTSKRSTARGPHSASEAARRNSRRNFPLRAPRPRHGSGFLAFSHPLNLPHLWTRF